MSILGKILGMTLLVAILSPLGGCTITADGAFITGTDVGIGDTHAVAPAPAPDDVCCWRPGFGRWF